tara:strand:- start:41 stop:559 length:519 start_codon:yes stop_codon:yes gene_type:complete
MDKSLYTNTKYSFERDESKTVVINVPMTIGDHTFDVNLSESLVVDQHADIYLDSLTTYNCNTSRESADNMGFILSIDQFELKTVSNAPTASNASFGRSIFIPNDQNINPGSGEETLAISKTHKGKKLNYVCSINPTNINRIGGRITNISGETMFATGGGRFIAEFVIISKSN